MSLCTGTTRACALTLAAAALASPSALAQCEVVPVQRWTSTGTSAIEMGESVAVHGAWSFAGSPLDPTLGTNAGAVFAFAAGGASQQLLGSDSGAGDQFGISLAAGPGRLIVGAYGDDDGGTNSGAVFVFEEQAGAFVEVQKLKAPVPVAGARFGADVALFADRLVVGAPWDDTQGTTSGSVEVYRFDGLTFVHEQSLSRSNAQALDRFGTSVSIWEGRLGVGAPGTVALGSTVGAVEVFDFDGAQWQSAQELFGVVLDGEFGRDLDLARDTLVVSAFGEQGVYAYGREGGSFLERGRVDDPAKGLFGISVATNGSLVAVGAPLRDAVWVYDLEQPFAVGFAVSVSGSGGSASRLGWSVDLAQDDLVAGAPMDSLGSTDGSAESFRIDCSRCGGSYPSQELRVLRPGGDNFGHDVDAEGSLAVVGDNWLDQATVLRLGVDGWAEEQILDLPGDRDQDRFGHSVAVSAGRIVVASLDAEGPVTRNGALYVYEKIGGTWSLVESLYPPDGSVEAGFGTQLAVDGDVIVASSSVGTPVCVYRHDGTGWRRRVLPDPEPGAGFGLGVDVDADRVVVSAPRSDVVATDAGRGFVYERSGNDWVLTSEVDVEVADAGRRLGDLLALDGDRLVIGSRVNVRARIYELEAGSWVQKDSFDHAFRTGFGHNLIDLQGDHLLIGYPEAVDGAGREVGRCLLYQRQGDSWPREASWGESLPKANANLGRSVVLNGDHALVGVPWRPGEDTPGMVASFPIPSAPELDLNPRWALAGDLLEVRLCNAAPLRPALLVVTRIQGAPTFQVVLKGSTRAGGRWIEVLTVPAGLAGLELELQGLCFDERARLTLTRPTPLLFD